MKSQFIGKDSKARDLRVQLLFDGIIGDGLSQEECSGLNNECFGNLINIQKLHFILINF